MDDVICTPHADINASRPIANVTEFMQWLKKQGHHITIWSTRLNDLENKLKTETLHPTFQKLIAIAIVKAFANQTSVTKITQKLETRRPLRRNIFSALQKKLKKAGKNAFGNS